MLRQVKEEYNKLIYNEILRIIYFIKLMVFFLKNK